MRHVPCAIVATLAAPVGITRPVHLDALLLAARFRVLGPGSFGTPLAEVAEEEGVPRASASYVVAAGLGGVAATREHQPRHLLDRRGDYATVDGARGGTRVDAQSPYRNAINGSTRLTGAAFLVWHALADPDGCLALATELACVGANSGTGAGRVSAWEAFEIDADPDEVGWFRDGRPVRRLPAALVAERLGSVPEGLDRGLRRPVAPYHATDEAVDCVEPRLGEMTRRRSELGALT